MVSGILNAHRQPTSHHPAREEPSGRGDPGRRSAQSREGKRVRQEARHTGGEGVLSG
jgi:hypothetical protein